MRKTRTIRMIIKHKYLLLFLSAFITYGAFDGTYAALDLSSITSATNIADALNAYKKISVSLLNEYNNISDEAKSDAKTWIDQDTKAATDLYGKRAEEITSSDSQQQQEGDQANNANNNNSDEQKAADEKAKKAAALEEKTKAYEDAKATEQSKENRMLSAATIGATGLGGMELAEGLSEKKADEKAEADMAAYIETMRCTYANGKSVKAGSEEIELPGANNQELYNYRNEYTTLAADLKERKEILGLKPGIESEEILDKFAMGLYDDENVGITAGSYESLYRANMLDSEKDQEKLDANKEEASKRIKGGAIAVGAGTLVGVVGDSLINGKLGEKLKELKENKANGDKVDTSDDKETIAVLKRGLKTSGLKLIEVNKVPWKKLDGIGAVKEYVQGINFGLISRNEAMKITSMTTTEVVGELIEVWYTTQHKNDTEETIKQNKLKCENPQSANDDITGTWGSGTCDCRSNSGKQVSWTEDAGCTYIQMDEV